MAETLVGAGVPIGVNDATGKPIHIGDELMFDPEQWGDLGCVFVVKLEGGKIVHPGSTNDLTNWCAIVRAWDEPLQQVAKGSWRDAIGCAPAIPGSITIEDAVRRGRGGAE